MINHSGGAEGSDTEWELIGEKYGVITKAYSFEGHKTQSKNRVILTLDELEKAAQHLVKANKKLKRCFPPQSRYIKALLLRNYYQVKNSELILAIGYFDMTVDDIKDGIDKLKPFNLKGGTAWAVQMAIDMRKGIHIFDSTLNNWYYYNYATNMYDKYLGTPNIAVENFAGIGTRDITPLGIKAISNVYERTFNREKFWEAKENE